MTIEIKYSSDDKELINTLQKMQAGLDKTARKLEQVGRSGRRGAQEAAGGFAAATGSILRNSGQVIASLTGIGSGLAAVLATVTALRAELDKQKQSQERARLTAMSVGEVMREVMQTFRPDASVGRADLMREFERISVATGGTSVKDIALAAKDVFSVGAETNRQALDAIEAAFRVAPGKPVDATELASRAVQLAKIQGTDNFKSVIGLLTNVAEATSIRDLPQLAATAPGSAAASLASGGTAEEGLEIFATLQQLIGDVEGRRTATAAETLIPKLAEFVPESAAEQKRGKPVRKGGELVGADNLGEFTIPAADIEAFKAAQGPQAKIELLRQSEALRRLFLKDTSFETRSETGVKEFLSGSERALREERLIQPKIQGIATPEERAVQEQAFEEFVRNLDAAPFQEEVEQERQRQRRMEERRLADEFGRRAADARADFETAIADIDQPGFDLPRDTAFRTEVEARLASEKRKSGARRAPEAIVAEVLREVAGQRPLPLVQSEFSQEDMQTLRDTIEELEQRARQKGDVVRPPEESTQRPAPQPEGEPVTSVGNMDRQNLALMQEQNALLRDLRDGDRGRLGGRPRRPLVSQQLGREVA